MPDSTTIAANGLSLRQVIEQSESSGNRQAVKFEAVTFGNMKNGGLAWTKAARSRISKLHDCDDTTACMIASTSWGAYQIMGFNLFDPSLYAASPMIGDYLTNFDSQQMSLSVFLRSNGIDFSLDEILASDTVREHFISKYNGPGDIAGYWALMQRSMADLLKA